MRIPDELGETSDRVIVEALGMQGASVKGCRIDFNDNEVAVELYVLDTSGRPIQQADGEPVTTGVDFPVRVKP